MINKGFILCFIKSDLNKNGDFKLLIKEMSGALTMQVKRVKSLEEVQSESLGS